MCGADLDLAVQKNHSTVPEAMAWGAAAGARYVILTHFSQRYKNTITYQVLGPCATHCLLFFAFCLLRQAVIPVEDFAHPKPDTIKHQGKAIVAFDMMSIHSSDLPILPQQKEALVTLYKQMLK
jgi:hypothetical protein